jgi:hypothetical protein
VRQLTSNQRKRHGASHRRHKPHVSQRNGASHRCRWTNVALTTLTGPAASALPLTRAPRELDDIDAELKGVTDRIVEMIGELS